MLALTLLVLALTAAQARSEAPTVPPVPPQPARHEVTSIPGFDGPFGFNSFSGYVSVAPKGKHMFYWLIGAEGADWESAPTLLWETGGPGCSSLLALLTEHGPFRMSRDGQSTLERNPYSWNKAGVNVIYLESPAGVGYSWAEDAGAYTTGDNQTAKDGLNFLRGFYEVFPELAKNPLILSGESYAGHYVPQLADAIFEFNAAATVAPLPLRGWLVGNPSWGEDPSHYWEFMAFHSIVSMADYNDAVVACNGTLLPSVSKECDRLIAKMRNATIGINPYNVLAPCVGKPSLNGGCFTADGDALFSQPGRDLSQTFVPCFNFSDIVDYFRSADVRKALGGEQKAGPWDVCSQVLNYTQYAPTVEDIYLKLAPTMDVMVYSGDVDSCVPFTGTEGAVDALNFPVKQGEGSWTAWRVDDQIAGYVRQYDVGQHGSLEFRSVRGAGHMVPTYKPPQALAMLRDYLKSTLSKS